MAEPGLKFTTLLLREEMKLAVPRDDWAAGDGDSWEPGEPCRPHHHSTCGYP